MLGLCRSRSLHPCGVSRSSCDTKAGLRPDTNLRKPLIEFTKKLRVVLDRTFGLTEVFVRHSENNQRAQRLIVTLGWLLHWNARA